MGRTSSAADRGRARARPRRAGRGGGRSTARRRSRARSAVGERAGWGCSRRARRARPRNAAQAAGSSAGRPRRRRTSPCTRRFQSISSRRGWAIRQTGAGDRPLGGRRHQGGVLRQHPARVARRRAATSRRGARRSRRRAGRGAARGRRRRARSCRPRARRRAGRRGTASGAMWPTIRPWVAPEKRPSVIRATSSPIPSPTIAAVTCSISRIPGPARGALVADHDHVAGPDQPRLDRGEGLLLATRTRAPGPTCRRRSWPASFTTEPSGARLPRRIARPPVGDSGRLDRQDDLLARASRARRRRSRPACGR